MARAGAFRERAAFERQTDAGTLDAYGNAQAPAWAPLVTLWADLRETPGRERIAAGRIEAPATATLRLRASGQARAIGAADRVTVRGAIWAITGAGIDPEGRGRLLEFPLERGGAVA